MSAYASIDVNLECAPTDLFQARTTRVNSLMLKRQSGWISCKPFSKSEYAERRFLSRGNLWSDR